MQAGRSVATTMGFTALDGLPMGTRCGALDPGVVLYLIQQKGMTAEAVTDLLYRRSGMLGMSGVSSDFRELLASPEPRARFAVESFCYWTARQIASLAAALGGLDGIVFTAGVGENAAPIRAAICRACAWLGVELDEAANAAHRTRITTSQPRRRLCHQDRRKPDDRPPRTRPAAPPAGVKLPSLIRQRPAAPGRAPRSRFRWNRRAANFGYCGCASGFSSSASSSMPSP